MMRSARRWEVACGPRASADIKRVREQGCVSLLRYVVAIEGTIENSTMR